MVKHCLLVLLLVVVLPVPACANAGTPLMLAGVLHLLFGNALIGVGEGWLIARLAGAKKRFCIPAMVAANYFSAWVGNLFLTQFLGHQVDLHLYNARNWIWLMVVLTYVMTLVLEWPFVAFCCRGNPLRWKVSVRTNLVVQTISYALIFAWYWNASRKSVYTRLEVVPPSVIAAKTDARIYFISDDNGDVCSVDLNGGRLRRLYALGSADMDDRLAVKLNGTNAWNLLFRSDDLADTNKFLVLATNLAGHVAEDPQQADSGRVESTSWNFGPVPSLGRTNEWGFWTDFWAAAGIEARNEITQERLRFALETPFVAWEIRNATQIAEDQVVFQLGRNQICFFDFRKRQIALIARGRGPVVVAGPGID